MSANVATATESPEQVIERIQELQGRLESASDAGTRELAEELVQAVIAMYGEGLDRILSVLFDSGEAGQQVAHSLAEDPLVGMLLLIHDLHPIPLEDRVQGALDSVRPYMESHGGNVELLALENGVARIHLRGSCSDCSASAVTLELAIKQALEEAAPDLEGLEVEGVAPQTMGDGGLPMVTGSAPTGMGLPVVISAPAAPPAWHDVGGAGPPAEGAVAAVTVSGRPLVIANIDGALLAYHDRCAGCGSPLHEGVLSAGVIVCPGCDRRFFLPRAGRVVGDESLQLDPVPLLQEQGNVRVALGG